MSGVLPDPRRHAYRVGLAAESLRGHVEASRYVAGVPRQIEAPALPLRREPRFDATLDTEALFGETLTLFDESEGWAWVQLARDGYVGYMPSEGLAATVTAPTHKVAALRTYVYPSPDFKTPPLALLSLNALVSAAGEEGRFLALKGGGFIIAEHARTLDRACARLRRCRARLSRHALSLGRPHQPRRRLLRPGAACERSRGASLPARRRHAGERGRAARSTGRAAPLARGDLVFWDGHVGIMTSAQDLVHASAYHMVVVEEPLAEAKERIAAANGGDVIGARRPERLSGAGR